MEIFVDSNILLHFQRLDQINWEEIAGTKSVTILVSRVVLRELDKHKRNPNPRISKRARDFLKTIETGESLTDDLKIKVITSRPESNIFSEFGLDANEQDDVLLASVLKHIRDNDNTEAFLLTDDTGLKIAAPLADIKVLTLPDKYAIIEADESLKEVARLKSELAKQQNRQPIIKVTFDDDLEYCEAQITKPDFEKFKKQKINEALLNHPELGEYSYEVTKNKLSQNQISQYNQQIKSYRNIYEHYLNKIEPIHITRSLSFPIKIKLSNNGTSPAQSIKLVLEFPEFMTIHSELNLAWPAGMPLPPNVSLHYVLPGGFTSPQTNHFGAVAYNIYRSGDPVYSGNQVTLELDSLRHKESFPMADIFVTLNDFDTANSFSINYTLHADNIPDKIGGTLNVKLIKLDQ